MLVGEAEGGGHVGPDIGGALGRERPRRLRMDDRGRPSMNSMTMKYVPVSSPQSKTGTMLGWERLAAAWASRRKRSTKERSTDSSGNRTLSATGRSSSDRGRGTPGPCRRGRSGGSARSGWRRPAAPDWGPCGSQDYSCVLWSTVGFQGWQRGGRIDVNRRPRHSDLGRAGSLVLSTAFGQHVTEDGFDDGARVGGTGHADPGWLGSTTAMATFLLADRGEGDQPVGGVLRVRAEGAGLGGPRLGRHVPAGREDPLPAVPEVTTPCMKVVRVAAVWAEMGCSHGLGG